MRNWKVLESNKETINQYIKELNIDEILANQLLMKIKRKTD